MAQQPVRRSSRLKEKEDKIYIPDTSSSSDTDDDRKVIVTPSRNRATPRKPNNFFKVYHSYNKDYGLDAYEKDFIDDRGMQPHTTPRRTPVPKKRSLKIHVSSSSDSDSDVHVPRKLVLSSDEESKTNQNVSDSDMEVQIRKKPRKGHSSYSAQLASSSEEEEEIERLKPKRPRRMKQLESDDEVIGTEETVRTPSSRARKLREERRKRADRMFQQLQESRCGSKEHHSASENAGSPADTEALDFEEDMDEIFRAAFETCPLTQDAVSSSLGMTLAESILFPPHEDSDSCSEEEESDWIVSDAEGDYLDLREMLETASSGDRVRIVYHPEGEGADTLLDNKECDFLPLPLIEAVCSEGGVEAIRKVLEVNNDAYTLEATDDKGYTALMHAVDRGDNATLKALLEAGASVDCKDDDGATPLHLAALCGWLECVETLVDHDHVVDCRDNRGWPPLLYAHFQNHQECVLALMKAKPKQLCVLGDLLKQAPHGGPDDSKKKTLKVIRSLLVSLAHEEAYYSLFNDFIQRHPSVLEEDGFSFLKHCTALLSFENKQAWFKRKLSKLKNYAVANANYTYSSLSLSNVSRDDVLGGVWTQLRNASETKYWSRPLSVTFRGEAGICSGPRKEFYTCFARTLSRKHEKLFCICDNGQLSLQPCQLLHKASGNFGALNVDRHTRLLELVAMVIAHAVFHGDIIGLHLTTPMIKQLSGLPLEHPADLEAVDNSFYHCISGLLEESGAIEDLELTFTHTVLCPWTGKTLDLPICEGGGERCVTEENKNEYVESLSRFKLEGSIERELEVFTRGFWRIIPQKCLQVFTPSELTLLISGVPEIDVDDWQRNTRYRSLKASDHIVEWFWKLVRSLKEEEKALLLKFATGSPCIPPGGFATLQGLGGTTPFTFVMIPGLNKIPQAATCFNTLKLTDYSSEQQFRNKMLIAIRYGCEGFEFS